MSEPTKEAIEEAETLGNQFAECGASRYSVHDVLYPDELARLIAHVRKQAREDALEQAIPVAQAWVCFAYHDEVATSIRALKTQGDTQ